MSPSPSLLEDINNDMAYWDAIYQMWKEGMAVPLEREQQEEEAREREEQWRKKSEQWQKREAQLVTERVVLWAMVATMVVAFVITILLPLHPLLCYRLW
jgi:hypothetical protein